MFVDKKQKINKIEIGNHKINYGFLNRKDNNSLFINISSWVKVINDSDKDFNKEMNLILKSIKQLIFNYNDSFYDNKKTIVSLDIRKNGFTYKGQTLYFETEKPRWEALTILEKDIRKTSEKFHLFFL